MPLNEKSIQKGAEQGRTEYRSDHQRAPSVPKDTKCNPSKHLEDTIIFHRPTSNHHQSTKPFKIKLAIKYTHLERQACNALVRHNRTNQSTQNSELQNKFELYHKLQIYLHGHVKATIEMN